MNCRTLYAVFAAVFLVSAGLLAGGSDTTRSKKSQNKLLIAFASYRDRPKHPNIFFYEHDGVANGKIVGTVGTPRGMASAEARPLLSHDGRYCAFTYELENKTGRVNFWDLKEQKLIDNRPAAQAAPYQPRTVPTDQKLQPTRP